ncbi:MAG: sigma-70 family RNA polymerase sigma factor [Planctomycetes bacterium]|nr:sigma-70 family RNA polymerase sigma factor [Planctomycetota bacterium]
MSDAINEIKLLKNCLKGHTEGFDLLVGRYQSLVCAITYSATGDVEKSEELAQETFLLAWKNLGQLKDLAKFKAWLCTIARRVIQNWARARQRDVVSKAAPLEAASSQSAPIRLPVEAAIQREQQAVVNQALKQLPEQFRVPLILYYREDKSTREVATLIGLNENATRQRIARARGLLKSQVAAMVETTLAQSKPGKAFTAGVLASLAGVSIEGVATVTAAGVAATGLSSLTLKIVGIAAGLLLITGVTFMVQNPKPSDPTPAQRQTQGVAADPNGIVSPTLTPTGAPVQPGSTAQEPPQEGLAALQVAAPPGPPSLAVTPFCEFKPRGVLSGLITDAETGEPVRDARVYIASNGMTGVRTDKHGFYHIDKLWRPGNSIVFIDSNDYVGFGMNADGPVLNLSQDQHVVKHFQLPRACQVEVRVVDTRYQRGRHRGRGAHPHLTGR